MRYHNERSRIPILTFPHRGDGESEYGIYHADRDFARRMGDPLITVIRAKSQAEAQLLARLRIQSNWEVIAVTDDLLVARKQDSDVSFRSGEPVSEESVRDAQVFGGRNRRIYSSYR